ncbi:hypothetical protein, partial [Streptomyces sp. NPDC000880]
ELPLQESEDLLEALVDTSLLESAAPGRYRYHEGRAAGAEVAGGRQAYGREGGHDGARAVLHGDDHVFALTWAGLPTRDLSPAGP